MTKFKFIDAKRSYYDDIKDTVYIRKNYKNERQLQKILKHEIAHVIITKTVKNKALGRFINILYDFHENILYYGFGFLIVFLIYNSDLSNCIKATKILQGMTPNFTIFNNTLSNISFNLTLP